MAYRQVTAATGRTSSHQRNSFEAAALGQGFWLADATGAPAEITMKRWRHTFCPTLLPYLHMWLWCPTCLCACLLVPAQLFPSSPPFPHLQLLLQCCPCPPALSERCEGAWVLCIQQQRTISTCTHTRGTGCFDSNTWESFGYTTGMYLIYRIYAM